jgi:superfamily II DNA/RNA helicase
MPPEIQRIVGTFLHTPVRVEVSRPATTAATVTQSLVATGREPHDKRDTLRRVLRDTGLKNAIVFCNRKREVAVLHRSLVRHGFNAVALHGDMDQPARMAALDQFRRGEAALLVASDVAARGLDIPEVSHVINFDVPHHADDYVHRVGRTGRAGRSGTAITLVAPADRKAIGAIEKLTGQTLEWIGRPAADGNGAEVPPARARSSDRGRERNSARPQRRERQRAPVVRRDDVRPTRAPQRERAEEAQPHLPAFLLRPFSAKA